MADEDTTTKGYWINWRILVCTIWICMSLGYTWFLIFKNEGARKSKDGTNETEKDPPGLVYEDEVWRPSLKSIHPRWLLIHRLLSFIILSLIFLENFYEDGEDIVYFYTQWTFFLLTLFFGLGTVLSIKGCSQYRNQVVPVILVNEGIDLKHGADGAFTKSKTPSFSKTAKTWGPDEWSDLKHGIDGAYTKSKTSSVSRTAKSLGPNEWIDLEYGADGAYTKSKTSNVSKTAKSWGPNEWSDLEHGTDGAYTKSKTSTVSKTAKCLGPNEGIDLEYGADGAYTKTRTFIFSKTAKSLGPNEECPRQIAGFWGYVFQIGFQMLAGAVLMTDFVFWFLIVPFLVDYPMTFLAVVMHSYNALVLLGESALNSLRFPWFRIAYFFLYTISFVAFQWGVHVFFNLEWPYPFLDLSDNYAPVWYIGVSLVHLPCYVIFFSIMKLKQWLLWKCFPQTCQCAR